MLQTPRTFGGGFTTFGAALIALATHLVFALPRNRQVRKFIDNVVGLHGVDGNRLVKHLSTANRAAHDRDIVLSTIRLKLSALAGLFTAARPSVVCYSLRHEPSGPPHGDSCAFTKPASRAGRRHCGSIRD